MPINQKINLERHYGEGLRMNFLNTSQIWWSLLSIFFFINSSLSAKQKQFQIHHLVGYVMHKDHVVHFPHFFGIHPSKMVITIRVGPAFSIKKNILKNGRIALTERFEASATYLLRDSLGKPMQIESTVYQTKNGLEESFDYNKKIPKVLHSTIKKLLQQSIAEYYSVNPKYKKMLRGKQTQKRNVLRYIKSTKN